MRVRQSGFTLMEAMVSLTILAMSMFATYGWVNISIEMLARTDEVLTQELIVGEFLEDLAQVDLDARPEGEMNRENLTLIWNARPVETKSGRNNADAIGYFDHTLYDIEIEIRQRQAAIAAYQTRWVSSRQVREPRQEE